jgi:putative transcriptional regulator
MSEENTVRVRRMRDGSLVQVFPDGSTAPYPKGKSDRARLDAMTEEEIEANALSDPDNPPISDEELKQFKRVPFAHHVRFLSGFTQKEFSARFGIPLGTLRDWEQGVSQPDAAGMALLAVIHHHPEEVEHALKLQAEQFAEVA